MSFAVPLTTSPGVELYGGFTATGTIALDVGARVVRIQPPSAGTLTVTLAAPAGNMSPGETVVILPAGTYPASTAIVLAGNFMTASATLATQALNASAMLVAGETAWVLR